MTSEKGISQPPRRKRIVICLGEYCNLSRRGEKLLKQVQPHVIGQPCMKLETARCLDMCAVGPNLVIYPDNLVFNDMNEAKLEVVIREHIKPCDSD